MREPRVVGETTPAETAMNDLRQGVEKYVAHLETLEAAPARKDIHLNFLNRPFWAHVCIQNVGAHMREVRIANARSILLATVRDIVRVEKPTLEQLDELETALVAYDAALEAP
jgi:hypothetical protein